jgi:hypothetical protein
MRPAKPSIRTLQASGGPGVAKPARDPVADEDPAIEQAIQTGCGTLLALEASLASVEEVPGEHEHAEAAIRAAIELLRYAIADLRELVPVQAPSQMAMGFVTRRRGGDH